MNNDFESWEQVNPALIDMFNHHLALIKQRLQARIELCPIVAFLDNGEIKSYIRDIKEPGDFPKMSEILKLVRGVKDSANIFAVLIAYTLKTDKGSFIAVDLEHKSGDCIRILLPIVVTGIFRKKASIDTTDKFIVETLPKFVWTD
ncbi:MAG: hypothetical protein LBH24_05395 [Clostridiales bacterium]|jgi:hypothetical protein|nr:hypothetical protein [Clostridiales bacterium]